MKRKLFFICPYSFLEPFLIRNFGEDTYFITALGIVFNLKEGGNADMLLEFIIRQNIDEIYLVNDVSCFFINKVLKNEL